jgi:hypothetical protein
VGSRVKRRNNFVRALHVTNNNNGHVDIFLSQDSKIQVLSEEIEYVHYRTKFNSDPSSI